MIGRLRLMLLRGVRLYDDAAFIGGGLLLEMWGLSSTIGSTLEGVGLLFLAVVLRKHRHERLLHLVLPRLGLVS